MFAENITYFVTYVHTYTFLCVCVYVCVFVCVYVYLCVRVWMRACVTYTSHTTMYAWTTEKFKSLWQEMDAIFTWLNVAVSIALV